MHNYVHVVEIYDSMLYNLANYINYEYYCLKIKLHCTLRFDDCTLTNFLWMCLKRRHGKRGQVT